MRISDWSSDVCSSDLAPLVAATKCSVVAQSLPERSARSIAATCPAMRRARFSRASLFSRCAITYPPILYLSLNQRVEKTVGAVDKWRVERQRPEAHRVGNEYVRTGGSRWQPYH